MREIKQLYGSDIYAAAKVIIRRNRAYGTDDII